MRDKNKYIDEVIETKLRKSELTKTSADFTQHLMSRISAENKALVEERKSDRIVKYVIGAFSFLIVGFTVLLGILSKTAGKQSTDTTGVGFNTVKTSNSFIENVLYYIEMFFRNVLGFFGLSVNSSSATIIMVVVLLVAVFLIGERLFLRGKYKSSVQLK